MLQLEGLAAERVGQEHVVVIEDRQRQVGRVALLRVGEHELRPGPQLRSAEDLLDRHAFPGRVELGPAGDAVDVGLDRLARQRLELGPGEAERAVHFPEDLEVPGGQVGLWR